MKLNTLALFTDHHHQYEHCALRHQTASEKWRETHNEMKLIFLISVYYYSVFSPYFLKKLAGFLARRSPMKSRGLNNKKIVYNMTTIDVSFFLFYYEAIMDPLIGFLDCCFGSTKHGLLIFMTTSSGFQ